MMDDAALPRRSSAPTQRSGCPGRRCAPKIEHRTRTLAAVGCIALLGVLSVSTWAVVEAAGSGGGAACSVTPSAPQGPFFQDTGVPVRDGVVCAEHPKAHADGEVLIPLHVNGTVRDEMCGKLLPNAALALWQADARGDYDDINNKDTHYCRSNLEADARGGWSALSIVPGAYNAGSTSLARHIHFRIRHAGYQTLVTQLYFEDDPSLLPARDCTTHTCWYGNTALRTRLINISMPARPGGLGWGWAMHGEFHIVMQRDAGFTPPSTWAHVDDEHIDPRWAGGDDSNSSAGDGGGGGDDGGDDSVCEYEVPDPESSGYVTRLRNCTPADRLGSDDSDSGAGASASAGLTGVLACVMLAMGAHYAS